VLDFSTMNVSKEYKVVRDIIGPTIISITEEEDLVEAVRRMTVNYIHRLPVVNSEGKLAGIITERDLRLACDSPFLSITLKETVRRMELHKVKECMTKEVITVDMNTPIVDAAKLIRVANVGGLPVVEKDSSLQGIITRTDLIDHLVRLLEPLKQEYEPPKQQ